MKAKWENEKASIGKVQSLRAEIESINAQIERAQQEYDLNKAAELLSSGSYKVNEVCYLVGFNTPSYFAKCFYKQFNKLPSSQLD